jgi:cell division protein FtsZ
MDEIMKAGDAGRTIARIKVVGVGGGGCNAVRRMMYQQRQIRGVEYVVVNTDIKSLELTSSIQAIHHCIQIGSHLTQGFGAGGDSKVGELAAKEQHMAIQKVVRGCDMVFIAAGMGGGTGTGSAPVVAELARETGALVIAVVTTPFSFEGSKRAEVALSGLRRLVDRVNSTIVVPNDHLLRLGDHDVPVGEAFAAADRVVAEGITAISELVNIPGEINCDLADVKRVMSIPGVAIMTTGWGEGPNAAEHAAEEVIFEPLLETHVNGARGVLFTFSGGPDLTLGSVQRAASLISQHVDPRALIFFGMNLPREELTGQVKINLVATGIKQSADSSWYSGIRQNLRNAAAQAQPSKLTRLSMKYAPR